MTIFGLKESDAGELARVLSRQHLDRAAAREVVARAMWTGIVEPGDRTAGMLVSELGASASLALVEEGRSIAEVLEALAGAGTGADQTGDEETLVRELEKALARWRPRLMPASALVALRRAERIGARLLIPGLDVSMDGSTSARDNWPVGLDDLGLHAPLALWCRGSDDALLGLRHSIALVGARAATGYGEHVTMEASAGLVDRGYAIVSGAAYGIDGMAHRAALASSGITIAFLAGGVDRFYPSGHDALLTRIAATGAVISELPCGEPPTKWRFLQRNRLIAAASMATVVLEAGWRSGSLNTAGHAAAMVRPLGAVPGPVTSAASAGCHRLIREFDAVCVTNADEMAELAPINVVATGERTEASPDAQTDRAGVGTARRRDVAHGDSGATELDGLESPREERSVALGDRPSLQLRVLDALSTRSARSSGDIAARCGLAASTVRGVLGVLQLENKVVEREGGWVVR